jgi:hypothetical protein
MPRIVPLEGAFQALNVLLQPTNSSAILYELEVPAIDKFSHVANQHSNSIALLNVLSNRDPWFISGDGVCPHLHQLKRCSIPLESTAIHLE